MDAPVAEPLTQPSRAPNTSSSRPKRTSRLSPRRWQPWLIVLAIIIVIVLDRAGYFLVPATDDYGRYHQQEVLVARVIDGDTIEIARPDALNGSTSTYIRLWGIDCPEIGRMGEPAEPLADEALAQTEQLVEGMLVRLHIEPSRIRDSGDRILAHVELLDGRLLNRELLLAGLAVADDRWPHARLVTYEQAEWSARSRKVGVWAEE